MKMLSGLRKKIKIRILLLIHKSRHLSSKVMLDCTRDLALKGLCSDNTKKLFPSELLYCFDYISQFVPHRRHYVSATKSSQLMLCKI
jgi:hypothetical protein